MSGDITIISDYNIESKKNFIAGLKNIRGLGINLIKILARTLNLKDSVLIKDIPKDKLAQLSKIIDNLLFSSLSTFNVGRPVINDISNGKHYLSDKLKEKQALNINFLKKIKDYRGRQHKAGHKVRHQKK